MTGVARHGFGPSDAKPFPGRRQRPAMRPIFIALALMTVGLAGCGDTPQTLETPSQSSTSSGAAPVAPAAPVTEVVEIAFDGKLGTIVHGCIFVPSTVCETREVVPESGDLFVDGTDANLTALDLTVTWTSATPATATLAFGAMVMTDCEGCEDVEFDFQQGTSPLRLQGTALALPLNESARLHVYGYNPQGIVVNPAVPGYAVVSVEQAFHIEGTATVLIPSR